MRKALLMTALFNKFANFIDKLLLSTVSISIVLVHNVAAAVNNEHIGNHLDAEGTLEVAVGIKQHFIFPAVVVNQRLDLVDVLPLVDADGDELHACLLLPVLIDLGDGVEFTDAGLAPGGEEVDNEGLAVVRQRVGGDRSPVEMLQCNGGKLGVETNGKEPHQGK